ncbi:MAG: patatin-like phospholipase family protein [Bacteroidota bacterium]|nr:patatin-like phospholipase family protein [Bacteroidota bacterium]
MNIGLVLSGGGMRGVAHIGVIKALEERGIFPSHISGTSAGAIVGAFYAAGIGWEKMLDFFRTIPIFHREKYARKKPGFIDTEKFYNDFKELLPDDDFKALQKPLFITGTDVLNGTLKYFFEGPLIMPILASASFPGVFTPTKKEGSFYVDGGVLNNFPIEPLTPLCDKIIGVYVNPLKYIKFEDLKHSYNVVERSYKIKMAAESIAKFKDCDLVIRPRELNNYATFYAHDIDTIFEIGYTKAVEALQQNASLFP